MKVEELIELYNRVYGVTNPKLQFLGYSDVQSNLVNERLLALPKMSWISFKQNYYNSVLYFFGEKVAGYISVNGYANYDFVSSQFVHLCSVIDSLNLSNNDMVEVFFLTGETFVGVNFSSASEESADEVLITGDKVDYIGTITGKHLNVDVSKHCRNTPILLIQYDNSVKMW